MTYRVEYCYVSVVHGTQTPWKLLPDEGLSKRAPKGYRLRLRRRKDVFSKTKAASPPDIDRMLKEMEAATPTAAEEEILERARLIRLEYARRLDAIVKKYSKKDGRS